ncbi:decarbamoylnovobiocin carbamoyltransferase [Abditibacteriota bacterium]|nr:decarbamoylnovobiocin carbamoyltransferase [Abditibacteriota bacterium]
MFILGINAFHGGASAAILKDGQLLAAVEDERFRRQKYWAGFPSESIKFCLEQAGISAYDLDHVAISRDPSAHLAQKALFALRKRPSFAAIRDRVANMGAVKDVKGIMCQALGLEASAFKAEFHRVEHHRAHMASAFFVSPFQDAAVLSIDGMGDFVSTMVGSGTDNKLNVDDQILFPHSLGIFFTALTQWLGFPNYGDEGKVQGLAPYGEPRYLDEMHKMVRLLPNGGFELDLKYFVHHAQGVDMTWDDGSPTIGTIYSPEVVKLLGEPRAYRGEYTQHHRDVAASMQVMLEEAEFHIVRDAYKRTGKKALCLAGGVALNSSFNGKILPDTEFEDIFIQPASGDAGTSLGAAFYVYHQVLGHPRSFEMKHSYTGPAYSNAQIEATLKERGLSYQTLDDDALPKETAALIAEVNVVGWFQGAAEWGPRALGNRSIVADPRRADMKEILNARIKHREEFRPFAPSLLAERTGDYFEQSYPDPFMVKVYKVREEKRGEIPAVTHVDGTGRLQTVERTVNERYWDLINAFGERSGTPVVLNTSFNDNEPIVCNPDEAINCFERTHMDAIVLGNFLMKK